MKYTVGVLIFGFLFIGCVGTDSSAPAQLPMNTQEVIPLSLVEGLIGPISRNNSIDEISSIVGSENIIAEPVVIKGDEEIQYRITLEGEYIYFRNRTFRILSPRFRTDADLGIGSKIGAFESTFGSGVLGESDLVEPIDYYDQVGQYLFSIIVDSSCIGFEGHGVQFDLACPVLEIWL